MILWGVQFSKVWSLQPPTLLLAYSFIKNELLNSAVKSFTFFFEASTEHQVVAPIIVNCEMLFVFLNTFQKQAFWKILFGGCSYYMSIVKYKMSRKPLKNKSSHSEAFWKKGVLNNFEKLTG